MLTLHTVTDEVKLLAKVLVVFIVLGIIGYFAYNAYLSWDIARKAQNPNIDYGPLPHIIFPADVANQTFSYSINTDEGTFAAFENPYKINVYRLEQSQPAFQSLDNAQKKVTEIGFSGSGTPIEGSNSEYEWYLADQPNKRIVIDIFSENFNLTSDYLVGAEYLAGAIRNEEEAKTNAENFLRSLQALPDDIDKAKTKVTLFALNNSQLTPAISLSTSQVARVDFFQADIEKIPYTYVKPPYSTINVIFAGGTQEKNMVEAHYAHSVPITTAASYQTRRIGTYPIKTAIEAYKELQEGLGYIASYNGTDGNVGITAATLAYYQADKSGEYLLPVIVFEGNNDFYAYIEAINSSALVK